MSLTKEKAKKFFGDLYDNSHTPDLNDLDAAAIRLTAKIDQSTMPGDKALGILMLNHALSAPKLDPAKKHSLTAAVLMNIKAAVVSHFLDEFPDTNIHQLIDGATKAGYKVDVLSPEVAKTMPRSVVQR